MFSMRHLINITEASDDAAEDDVIKQLLGRFSKQPKTSAELKISTKTLVALAAKHFVICDGKMTDAESAWSLTNNGENYLEGKAAITEDDNSIDDGQDSPLTRKRKRSSDPSNEKWFKSLFSK